MCILEGKTRRRVLASGVGSPRVERPFALDIMSSKQPERAQLFLLGMDPNHLDLGMHHQSEEERLANDVGQSDSRIVPQQRTDQVSDTKRLGEGTSPGTFDFLGFTHYRGHSRSGKFQLKRKTSSKKLRSKFSDLKEWPRHNLTQPIGEVWKTLNSKLCGHYQFDGINDNWPSLIKYQQAAKRLARRWICRRSQKGRISLRAYGAYLQRNPLADPIRPTDLISRARRQATAVHR